LQPDSQCLIKLTTFIDWNGGYEQMQVEE
jgi:hypothetical protein